MLPTARLSPPLLSIAIRLLLLFLDSILIDTLLIGGCELLLSHTGWRVAWPLLKLAVRVGVVLIFYLGMITISE